jgi:type II secretory pathway pseudopilin PulG
MRTLRIPGFSYVELMMVLGILMVLLMLVSMTIVPAITRADSNATALVLVSDLFSQQQKSMQGELSSSDETGAFGVYFQPTYYVLFQGATYNPNHPDNFRVNLPEQLTFSSIQVPNQIIQYQRIMGDVVGYNAGANTVTLSPINGDTAKVLQVNRYGVVEIY